MGVRVDEAGRHHQIGRVDGSLCAGAHLADFGDSRAFDRDVAMKSQLSAPVDYRSVPDHVVICHGALRSMLDLYRRQFVLTLVAPILKPPPLLALACRFSLKAAQGVRCRVAMA